jgi:hypothetical protein
LRIVVSESVSPVAELVRTILSEANRHRGDSIHDELRNALNALADHPDRRAGRLQVVHGIPEVESPTGAGMLAVWCGASVEGGADPQVSLMPILDALLNWTTKIRTNADGDLVEEPDPELVQGLMFLSQGLVAHLAEHPELRDRLRSSPEVMQELERIEPFSFGVTWVSSLLRFRSGTLLVLHVASRKGFRATYANLQNCFHLFTLLQHVLEGRLPDAQRTSAEVVAVAEGKSMANVSDSAWWHYGPGNVPEANLMAPVWGEMSPEIIPLIDGVQVLLLWPSQLAGRSWDGSFFMPIIQAAPPSATILDELSAQEIDEWWGKLGLPMTVTKPIVPTEPSSRPWWKFWSRG